MIKAWRRDHATLLSRMLGLAAFGLAASTLTANCNGAQPDPNSANFFNGRGDP